MIHFDALRGQFYEEENGVLEFCDNTIISTRTVSFSDTVFCVQYLKPEQFGFCASDAGPGLSVGIVSQRPPEHSANSGLRQRFQASDNFLDPQTIRGVVNREIPDV